MIAGVAFMATGVLYFRDLTVAGPEIGLGLWSFGWGIGLIRERKNRPALDLIRSSVIIGAVILGLLAAWIETR